MNDDIRSAEVLVREALEPKNLVRLKTDPAGTLNELKTDILQRPRALEQDRFIYRVVICALSLLALAVAGTAIMLALINNGAVTHFPEILTALGSAALGALAGILAPSQKG